MPKVTMKTIEQLGGESIVQSIVKNAPEGAVHYFHEVWGERGHFGFYSDKFIVGTHKTSTHYKIEDLQRILDTADYHGVKVFKVKEFVHAEIIKHEHIYIKDFPDRVGVRKMQRMKLRLQSVDYVKLQIDQGNLYLPVLKEQKKAA